MPDFKSIRVEGDDLALLRELKAIRVEADAEQQKLQDEFKDRADALNSVFQKRHEDAWAAIQARFGLDTDGGFTADMEYLDDCGVAFIKKTDDEPTGARSLAELLGMAGAEAPVEAERVLN